MKASIGAQDVASYVQTLLRCRVEEDVEIAVVSENLGIEESNALPKRSFLRRGISALRAPGTSQNAPQENFDDGNSLAYLVSFGNKRIRCACFPFWLLDDNALKAAFSVDEMSFMASGEADPVGTVFFLMSLWWERRHIECLNNKWHYNAEHAFLYSFGLLQTPVADILMDSLCGRLALTKKQFFATPKFLMTHDIDMIYPYNRHIRLLAQDLIRKKNPGQFLRRAFEMLTRQNYADPAAMARREAEKGIPSISFVLNTPQRGVFKGSGYKLKSHPEYKKFLQEKAKDPHISFGLHYNATYLEDGILGDWKELEDTLGVRPSAGRSHYLVMDACKSYEIFERNGVRFDFTGGFNYSTGYKFGTSLPFRPYDFARRKPFPFYEVPLLVMDSGLLAHSEGDPRREAEIWRNYEDMTVRTGGLFCLLWHNTSLCYNGWNEKTQRMYEAVDAMRERGVVPIALRDLEALADQGRDIWDSAYGGQIEGK